MNDTIPKPDNFPALVGAFLSDALALAAIPGAALAGLFAERALSQWTEKRIARAREILLSEVRAGNVTLSEDQIEEGIGVYFRYQRAALEGAARINLRLLAQEISTMNNSGKFSAQEFLYDADMIATLREKEILLLARMFKIHDEMAPKPWDENRHVTGAAKRLEKELVPSVFSTTNELKAWSAALSRTGMVMLMPGFDGGTYVPTSLLIKLVEKTSFEDAIEKEKGHQ